MQVYAQARDNHIRTVYLYIYIYIISVPYTYVLYINILYTHIVYLLYYVTLYFRTYFSAIDFDRNKLFFFTIIDDDF